MKNINPNTPCYLSPLSLWLILILGVYSTPGLALTPLDYNIDLSPSGFTDRGVNPKLPSSEQDLVFTWDSHGRLGQCQIVITDSDQNPVFSSFGFLEAGFIKISHPQLIFEAGKVYSYKICLSGEESFPVVSDVFTFWPECNQVKDIQISNEIGGGILVSWIDPDPSTKGTYRVRYKINGQSEYVNEVDAGFATSILLDLSGKEGDLSVSVQKRCRYDNGVFILGRWASGPVHHLVNSHSRAVDCSTLSYSFSCSNITDSSVLVTVNGPLPGGSSDGPWYRIRYRIKNTQIQFST